MDHSTEYVKINKYFKVFFDGVNTKGNGHVHQYTYIDHLYNYYSQLYALYADGILLVMCHLFVVICMKMEVH